MSFFQLAAMTQNNILLFSLLNELSNKFQLSFSITVIFYYLQLAVSRAVTQTVLGSSGLSLNVTQS